MSEAVPGVPVPIVEGNKHFLAVFFFSFIWGVFGVDRFYLGKLWTGVLKLVTFGGFGIWAIVDLALIMNGAMQDSQGHALKEYTQYKKLASQTILWFTVATCATLLVSGILAIYTVSSLTTQFLNNGSTNQLQQLKQTEQSLNTSSL